MTGSTYKDLVREAIKSSTHPRGRASLVKIRNYLAGKFSVTTLNERQNSQLRITIGRMLAENLVEKADAARYKLTVAGSKVKTKAPKKKKLKKSKKSKKTAKKSKSKSTAKAKKVSTAVKSIKKRLSVKKSVPKKVPKKRAAIPKPSAKRAPSKTKASSRESSDPKSVPQTAAKPIKFQYDKSSVPKKAAPSYSHRWQYYDNHKPGGPWHNYDAGASDVLEEAFLAWQSNPATDVAKVFSGEWHYAIDFNSMQQTNLDYSTHTTRKLRRVAA
eukprot:TRINITY_DN17913_c0_g1_i1.p1 TRINITY_DN17913_c0_g1~~TRINITY_DN17913_c0_g1_i1.p1  ORF type:complete len:272 (+),score=40.18 TRINITY_DN17913_c0_g1_i1:43-858(+)